MQIEWVISPLAQCLFLALALVACLGLFVSVKLEMAVLLRDFHNNRRETGGPALTSIAEPSPAGREIGVEAPALLGGRTLTPTSRAQALQMQQRGQSPAATAAALGAPRNEIDLLFKIAGLAGQYAQPPAKSPSN